MFRKSLGPGTDSGFEVTTHGGRRSAGLDAVAWAMRATDLGAGELLLNSMDADGTQDGFDLELIRLVRSQVSIPVIASGGAGEPSHFPPAVDAGADAVLAATVFHFGVMRIGEGPSVSASWACAMGASLPKALSRCTSADSPTITSRPKNAPVTTEPSRIHSVPFGAYTLAWTTASMPSFAAFGSAPRLPLLPLMPAT